MEAFKQLFLIAINSIEIKSPANAGLFISGLYIDSSDLNLLG
jgi:hypothetical protein